MWCAVARVVTDLEKLEVIRDLEGHEGNAVWYAPTRHTLLRGKLLTSAGWRRGVDFHVGHDVVISGDQRGLFIVHRLSTGEQLCTRLLLIAHLF